MFALPSLVGAGLIGVVALQPAIAAAQTLTVLYDFKGKQDASYPLTPPALHGSFLFGTAQGGGGRKHSFGTIYQLKLTGGEAVLYRFAQTRSGDAKSQVIYENGMLYGTAPINMFGGSSLYSYNLNMAALTQISIPPDGDPIGGVIYDNGELYGVQQNGYDGAVYDVNPTTGVSSTLYTFSNDSDGGGPVNVVYADGKLFGATYTGGTNCVQGTGNGCGTVFTLNPSTGNEKTLYRFTGGADGMYPGPVIFASGVIYGMTASGGASNFGSVFAVDAKTGAETTLYSFSAARSISGLFPLTYLDGSLYGTVSQGANIGPGYVFKIDTITGTESDYYDFVCPVSCYPVGGLSYGGGAFYGAAGGGTAGTIYKLQP